MYRPSLMADRRFVKGRPRTVPEAVAAQAIGMGNSAARVDSRRKTSALATASPVLGRGKDRVAGAVNRRAIVRRGSRTR